MKEKVMNERISGLQVKARFSLISVPDTRSRAVHQAVGCGMGMGMVHCKRRRFHTTWKKQCMIS